MASDKKIEKLVDAINESIREILNMNEKNRVGVVLYSGSTNKNEPSSRDTASCLLPLDRYTSISGQYLSTTEEKERFVVKIADGVLNSENIPMYDENDKGYLVKGNTYIQNGLFEGFEKLVEKPTENMEDRIPIITLMSDGAPTAASVYYTDRGDANVETFINDDTDIRMAFLTQLTAAWTKESLKEYYSKTPQFYTVGLLSGINESEKTYAEMVLNPSDNTNSDLDNWWDTFFAADKETTIHLNAEDKVIDIFKKDDKLQQSEMDENNDRYYVDEFFYVNDASDLSGKFRELVERIKIESAEFPTEEEENRPNYSGYLLFEDTLGEYMNVADMTGVMYGGKLHTGSTFAEKMEEGGNATAEEKTEFLKSLIERLTITEEEAEKLLKNAQDIGQICYDASSGNASNYIAWYAKEDGT